MRNYRKYPNRKLYDVDSSSYVNLKSMEEDVIKGRPFTVTCYRTGADLTSQTLKQILTRVQARKLSSLNNNDLFIFVQQEALVNANPVAQPQ